MKIKNVSFILQKKITNFLANPIDSKHQITQRAFWLFTHVSLHRQKPSKYSNDSWIMGTGTIPSPVGVPEFSFCTEIFSLVSCPANSSLSGLPASSPQFKDTVQSPPLCTVACIISPGNKLGYCKTYLIFFSFLRDHCPSWPDGQ